jgi:glycosyltransferase involved in cell wall biosynthesis
VLNLQDGDPFKQVFNRWFILPIRPLLTYGFRNATVIQPLSTYLVSWARSLGFKGHIEIVPNGANVAHFESADAAQVEQRKTEIGKTSGQIVLVSTSRLVRKNALDDVIRSLVLVPDQVHFYNFGFGPDQKMLEELAEQSGVSERVHLLPHPGLETLPQYLHACDMFIRPSRTEGFGVSFIEAMAAGLPVVATQEGGIADFLFDEKRNPGVPATGWAVTVDSPDQIALAVKDIMTNPDKVARIRANALALVREKYDWNLIAKQMRGVFDSLNK